MDADQNEDTRSIAAITDQNRRAINKIREIVGGFMVVASHERQVLAGYDSGTPPGKLFHVQGTTVVTTNLRRVEEGRYTGDLSQPVVSLPRSSVLSAVSGQLKECRDALASDLDRRGGPR